jgi:hypothetical protein
MRGGDEKEMEEDGENIGKEGASKIVTSFWSCVQINLFSSIFPYDLASRDEGLSKSSPWGSASYSRSILPGAKMSCGNLPVQLASDPSLQGCLGPVTTPFCSLEQKGSLSSNYIIIKALAVCLGPLHIMHLI